MKFIQKIKQTHIILSIIIFIVSTIFIFFTLKNILRKKLDEKLLWDKELIGKKIKYDYPLPIFEVEDFESLDHIKDTMYYKDTLFFQVIDGVEKRELYRELTSIETLRGKTYKISTRSSLVKNQDFIIAITTSVGIVILLLIFTLFYVNNIIINDIWRPFYKNLEKLKNFSVEKNEPIKLEKSNIDEFRELNESLVKLTNKINSDFRNLKEFTDNASHEMQTPLAIMHSKLELLMQSDNLKYSQKQKIISIYQTAQRLSKLNKTLLLLSKIENYQFSDKEVILINDAMSNQLEIFEDFMETKNITINKKFSLGAQILANRPLFDMVLSNLISNAIKHNIENGSINVETSEFFISISNSGNPINISSTSLFERFKKESSSSNSFGLGLAIVKKICDLYQWKINHSYIENQHNISIYF